MFVCLCEWVDRKDVKRLSQRPIVTDDIITCSS